MPRQMLVVLTINDGDKDDEVLEEIRTTIVEDVDVVTAPHVIATGNPMSGLDLIGPFVDGDEATEYAESSGDHAIDDDWWVVDLHWPKAKESQVKVSAPKHEPEWGDDD